jgi:uncharacterized protein (UPF0276 family)
MMMESCEGAGLGLRIPHIQHILAEKPKIPWFEVHICNFLSAPLNRKLLFDIAQHYPLSFHGVSLNLGGLDPFNESYLSQLKQTIDEFQPTLISEHVCFTALNEQYFHDLLPIPFTQEGIHHFADRIDKVQNFLGRRLLIENVSRYFNFTESTYSEAEFITEICRKSGCGLILDLNNIYVNQSNFPQDPGNAFDHFIQTIPLDIIDEIHLAGHSKQGDILIDSHSTPICDDVWGFYQRFLNHCNKKSIQKFAPCLIEWDNNLPTFDILNIERKKADCMIKSAQLKSTSPPWNQYEK